MFMLSIKNKHILSRVIVCDVSDLAYVFYVREHSENRCSLVFKVHCGYF